MKIHLERTLPTCSRKLRCVACTDTFIPTQIRTLLCRDDGLIQGDICPNCLHLGASGIQTKLKATAAQKMHAGNDTGSITQYRSALEQFEAATTEIKLPRFYHWWLKRLEILAQETQELEKARLGISHCQCGHPRSHRITFLEEDLGN